MYVILLPRQVSDRSVTTIRHIRNFLRSTRTFFPHNTSMVETRKVNLSHTIGRQKTLYKDGPIAFVARKQRSLTIHVSVLMILQKFFRMVMKLMVHLDRKWEIFLQDIPHGKECSM